MGEEQEPTARGVRMVGKKLPFPAWQTDDHIWLIDEAEDELILCGRIVWYNPRMKKNVEET